MSENFALKCRLCFENNANHDLIADKRLLCCIFQYLNIKVEDGDEMPKNICTNCKKRVEEFDKYAQKVKIVETNLRALLEIKTQTNQSDCDDFDTSSVKSDNVSFDSDVKFKCTRPDCAKTYKTSCSLRTHNLKHEGKRDFLCVTCGKDFVSRNSLTCHEKIHATKKGYVCKSCDLEFSVRSNLRAHEKKYHEGFKFYCSQCTKSFLNKCSLERHEKTHTGIKEFKCNDCTAQFYTNKELIKHKKYHKGTRQFKCERCFKMFFEKHHLLIHNRIHTGEKPYVCDFPECGKSFTESQKLKKHQKSKHISL